MNFEYSKIFFVWLCLYIFFIFYFFTRSCSFRTPLPRNKTPTTKRTRKYRYVDIILALLSASRDFFSFFFLKQIHYILSSITFLEMDFVSHISPLPNREQSIFKNFLVCIFFFLFNFLLFSFPFRAFMIKQTTTKLLFRQTTF